MKLLILGSEGFIGGHCVDYFTAQHYEITGVDLFERPSRNYQYVKVSRLSSELEELFTSHTFDFIINASGSGNVPYSMNHPVIDFEANSLDTIRVLDAIRRHRPSGKYIHISSAAVYGNPITLPVKEEDRVAPLSPYGWHKLIAENICHEYSSIYQLPIAVLRPFSVYGPGLKKQLLWDIFQQLSAKDSIELFGTGEESRDFIYVTDLVKAIECIFHQGRMQGEIYNVASGEETRIKDVVHALLRTTGNQVSYRFNGVVRSGDPLNWKADISKLSALGFVPGIGLQEGLAKVSGWINDIEKLN